MLWAVVGLPLIGGAAACMSAASFVYYGMVSMGHRSLPDRIEMAVAAILCVGAAAGSAYASINAVTVVMATIP